MVGPQGVGKSHMSQHLSKLFSCKIINGDKIGVISKQIKLFDSIKDTEKCIIIDNTNSKKEVRNKWIQKAKGWNIIIIYFDIPKIISFHMTQYRMYMGGQKIPGIAIHKYYKS